MDRTTDTPATETTEDRRLLRSGYEELGENGRTAAGAVAQAIRERRTVRLFSEASVPDELVEELMDTACWAPNHGLREPWRFILFKGGGRLRFAEAVLGALSAEDRQKYGTARKQYYLDTPLHLVVASPEDPRQKQRDEDYAAACCWIQTFQLAAWEQGLGVVWKTNPYMYLPAFRQAVGVREGERVAGVLHIGYPAVVPPARPRKSSAELLTIYED